MSVSGRANKACDRCRLKKIKCYGSFPCIRCRADAAFCHFGARGRHKKKEEEQSNQVAQLEFQHRILQRALRAAWDQYVKPRLPDASESQEPASIHEIVTRLGVLKDSDFAQITPSDFSFDESLSDNSRTARQEWKMQRKDDNEKDKMDGAGDSDIEEDSVSSGNGVSGVSGGDDDEQSYTGSYAQHEPGHTTMHNATTSDTLPLLPDGLGEHSQGVAGMDPGMDPALYGQVGMAYGFGAAETAAAYGPQAMPYRGESSFLPESSLRRSSLQSFSPESSLRRESNQLQYAQSQSPSQPQSQSQSRSRVQAMAPGRLPRAASRAMPPQAALHARRAHNVPLGDAPMQDVGENMQPYWHGVTQAPQVPDMPHVPEISNFLKDSSF